MANRAYCRVERMARVVVKLTELKCVKELLEMLPVDLCQEIITDGNANQIRARINRLRREKEDAFALITNLGHDWKLKPEKRKKMQKLIDNSSKKFSLTQKTLQRQIKFLNALSCSIYELKFIKK